jgi:hypothetical protein
MRAVDSFLIKTPAIEIRFKPLFSVEGFLLYPRPPFLPNPRKLHRRHFPKRRGFFFQGEANQRRHDAK